MSSLSTPSVLTSQCPLNLAIRLFSFRALLDRSFHLLCLFLLFARSSAHCALPVLPPVP